MLVKIISLLSFLSLVLSSVPAHSAVFNISSGDVTGLIAAINTANVNGEENTINLAPGTYSLTSIDNSPTTFGSGNGLPVITGTMNINGESAETTIIERNSAAPDSVFSQLNLAESLHWTGSLSEAGMSSVLVVLPGSVTVAFSPSPTALSITTRILDSAAAAL